ncbi:hypothetical protein MANES_15G130900v8 [Manihot esculenta]|uniref:Uncharacterized protein n=2 Tax=Manihot esculenta TaxID=3983 RepID=A0ACB7GCQ2_MANES|nr:hypothetical protein MANES_15G130900v8 [Manihot esculenta]
MMPRRTRMQRRSTMVRPVTFSSCIRFVSNLATAYMTKHQKLDVKLQRYSPDAPGDSFAKLSLEEKSELSESSEEEESKSDDFHGVKMLLQNYLDNKQWDLSGFVDLILGQSTVGTVVKKEDDEDDGLFSVVTALNLGRYKDHKCIMEIREFLIEVCQDRNVIDDLRLLWTEQAHDVGLLVSQRVTNLPLQLLPLLYSALFYEVLLAAEDEPTEELRKALCFKSYLIVSKIYKHKNADYEKGESCQNEEFIIYIKPEDEIFHKLCLWSFCFPLHSEDVTTHEVSDYRLMGLVMAVEAHKISSFLEELHSLFVES